jgi:DNA-binding response OmpR family regulator
LALKKDPASKDIRILVVDDEQDIMEIIKLGLKAQGFVADGSQDPAKVLERYRPGSYDLLLIDIRMPGMNGFELYKAIRKLDPRVKVCFITAFEIYFDEFRKVFPKLNVSCFIRKPVTIAELARIIQEELTRPEVVEEAPKQYKNRREEPMN